jgi:hypothetical protein
MRLSKQDQRNYGILAVFLAIAGYVVYSQLSTPDAAPPAAPVIVSAPSATSSVKRTSSASGATRKPIVVTTDGQLDPTLHMEAMLVTESLVYSGTGRNIFSANSAPEVAIPKVIAPVRIPTAIAPVRIASGPPPPPPIDLKFFGTETNGTGSRRAFLLHGEDVFIASAGDIVQRRYRVISVDARSILIEDIANSNRQTLPLLVN